MREPDFEVPRLEAYTNPAGLTVSQWYRLHGLACQWLRGRPPDEPPGIACDEWRVHLARHHAIGLLPEYAATALNLARKTKGVLPNDSTAKGQAAQPVRPPDGPAETTAVGAGTADQEAGAVAGEHPSGGQEQGW